MGRRNDFDNMSSSDSDSDSSSAPSPHRIRRERRSRKRIPSSAAAQQLQASAPQAAAGGASEDKKKKKSKVPPQESIDKIWEKFSQKKFSKALAVLPFSPAPASTSTERGNELLCAGYERAAEECRRRVRKIIAECRRINSRYRDPGWDIDWDFKWEKGHCLNSLGSNKFDICASNLANPAANIPKAVKRVHEIYKKPTFMENVLPGDIKQGNLGNCWLIASLTGLANVPDGIKRICVEYDTKIGIYGFVFHRDGEWIYSIIDDKLFLKSPCWDSPSMQRDLLKQIDREDVESVYRETYQTGSKALFFGQNKDQNETWVPLLEKAYAKAHGDYACLTGGWIGEALEDLSGGVTTELLASDIFDTDAFWDNELSKVNQEFLFGCSTGLLDGGYGERDGISEGHAYVVMEARTLKDGTRLCKLRNPWGKIKKGNWEGAWSDGSKEWTTEVQQELDHTFASDSTFWISYDDLLRKYQHFDRTRLFKDPSWRSCQRWAGVEVPWKPKYNEKFHIKLTKESPIVLVLSQLDIRYFRGLQGQYNFRLQFRLHEEGSPGAEDYIVRSHGNYLMDRSVSIELPSMLPGKYVVFISVIGERDNDIYSTEEVVKRECKGRTENEKLAQVGEAYDLAHAKAANHLKKLSEVRKKSDGKKASESRRKERRKKWERRQAGRDVKAKQAKKNEEKKKKLKAEKKAKAETEKKAAEEKAAKEAAEKKILAEKEAAAKAAEQKLAEQAKLLQAAAMEADNASVASNSSSSGTAQHTPQDSPRIEPVQPIPNGSDKVEVPPVDNTTTAAPPKPETSKPSAAENKSQAASGNKPMELKIHCCSCSHEAKKTPEPAADSDGYSSDSPVEDYENLYEPDDTTSTLVSASPTTPTSEKSKDSKSDDEDADTPDPWNAIAVVGFRVYSKDKDLELRVIMEGGLLEQDGMGTLGEADLDNGVANAGGQRGNQQQGSEGKGHKTSDEGKQDELAKGKTADKAGDKGKADGDKEGDDSSVDGDREAHYQTIIERKTSEFGRVMEDQGEGDSVSAKGSEIVSQSCMTEAAEKIFQLVPALVEAATDLPTSFGILGNMCIQLNRYYQACGHQLEKIVRCALPYYWKELRVDRDTSSEPFFGCLDCLDEFDEEYSIHCPECTGEGSVHSRSDLVSRNHVKDGSQNADAYELAKQNYHRYLVDFLQWFAKHRALLFKVDDMWLEEEMDRGNELPDEETYREVMQQEGPNMWSGPNSEDKVLAHLMEKTVAELKCRLDKSHPAQDRFGEWEQYETHLSEHRPFLNNISTALRRGISNATIEDCTRKLSILFHPIEADDVDDEQNSDEYDNQPFYEEAELYDDLMEGLKAADLKGPTKPGGRGIPYDVLEFVPQLPTTDFNNRIDRLKIDLLTEKTNCEILAPSGADDIRGGRDGDEYARNESFVEGTLSFIFELLALDPGLSRVRMIEIGKLFHSLVLEPWYFEFGHDERQAGEGGEGHEEHNVWLRQSVIDLDNALDPLDNMRLPNFATAWWPSICYKTIVDAPNMGTVTIDRVHRTALAGWRQFYVNWLQILANVELTHTKLTQEQLDAETDKSCPVCADDYEVDSPNNCAVWIECENNHTLCKKCYVQLSLTPTRPYNDLFTDKFCPQCRSELKYESAFRNITEGLNLMPSLSTDFPYNS